ncbi:hypothetical protein MYX07_06520 [Patescibacteria group bacterium AH-259-L07]|nr:hypothetical protein [Patescibacteria group bacterium AH-259-L07]
MLIIGAIVLAGGLAAYRHAGPSFTFTSPAAITLVEGEKIMEREVAFPNFLPTQWHVTFSPTPLFKVGDVIEIDVDSLEDGEVDYHYIRVNDHPSDTRGKNVTASYIFRIFPWPENKEGVVRLEIDYIVSDNTVAHRQKGSGSEWFWLREVYRATVIGID